MTLRQAQQIVSTLAKQFKVSEPKVQFKRRYKGYPASRSDYDIASATINLASWDVPVDTVLHEFAHHLCQLTSYDAHKEDFFFTLILIIDFYYTGDLTKYRWKHEYKILQRYYTKHFCK